MTETFNPPAPPVLGASKKTSYRTRQAPFGDGYIQRSADGINNKELSWDLAWTLPPAQIDTIEAFFDSMAGYQAFYYTKTGDTQRKYICLGTARAEGKGNYDTLTATLQQVFDP